MSASVLFRKPTPGLKTFRGRAAARLYFANGQAPELSQKKSAHRIPLFAPGLSIVWTRLDGYASCHRTWNRGQRIPACNRVGVVDLMSSNDNFIQNGAYQHLAEVFLARSG